MVRDAKSALDSESHRDEVRELAINLKREKELDLEEAGPERLVQAPNSHRNCTALTV